MNVKLLLKQTAKWRVLYLFVILAALSFAGAKALDIYDPTVSSDKDDYTPGEVAIIKGYGWTQDSLVDVHLEEEPAHDHHHGYHDTKVNADGSWTIKYQIEERHLGVKFTVIVVGKQTAHEERAYFTDGKIDFYTQGLPAGTAVNVTYSYSGQGNNNGSGVIPITAPGPATYTVNNANFNYTYPNTVIGSDGLQYVLTSTPTGFITNTGGGNQQYRITGNYVVACTAPSSLRYSSNTATYCTGTAITPNSPTSSGGAVTSYSISSALPAGLSFNTTTGDISGTPTTASAATNYTVTATNACGSTTTTVNIAVGAAPTSLSYTTPVSYCVGTPITANSPTVTGSVTSYTVSPALPAGLSINPSTGVISGTPTTASAAADYTVTATNSCGSTTANVNIAVDTAPTFTACPTDIITNTAAGTCGAPVTYTTTTSTNPTSFTYSFSGATTDSGSGNGSGSVFNIGTTTVTVTATNDCGSTTCTFDVTVNDNEAPVLTAAANQDVELGAECSIVVPDVTGTATDNCAGTTITQLPAAGTVVAATDGQTIAVVVTATDAAGNTDEATVTLTAQDVTAPVLTAAANQDVELGAECSIVVPDVTGTATDNCAGTTITQLPAAGTVVAATDGQTIAVVVTATDAAGNTDEATVTLTAQDVTAPVLTAAANQDVELGAECSIVVPDVTGTATDNCAGTTITQLPAAGTVVAATDGQTIAVVVTATDAAGNTDEATVTLTAQDVTAPVLTAAANQDVELGAECSIVVPDVTGTATDNCAGTTITQLPAAGTVVAATDGQTIAVVVTATDAAGNTDEATVTLTAQDVTAPTIACPSAQTKSNNPGTCTYTAVGSEFDPTYSDNCGVTSVTNNYNNAATLAGAVFEEGTTSIIWTVVDAAGNTSTCTFNVTVENADPILLAITGPSDPVQVGSPVTLSANYTDNNLVSGEFTFSSDGETYGNPQPASISDGRVSGSYTNLTPGVYNVKLKVTDACGVTTEITYEGFVVVFDPNGGFVTGGGWIYSNPGSMPSKPAAEGRATFGFNAKYKPGKNDVAEVDGNTNFQFRDGDFHFKSTNHTAMSLVVAGRKATYRGEGTVNGDGRYEFMVTVIDGNLNGGDGVDKFRIKIWGAGSPGAVIYDNELGIVENADATTALGSGSIVIHKVISTGSASSTKKLDAAVIPLPESISFLNYPNPYNDRTTITFTAEKAESFALEVYDVKGALVKKLDMGVTEAGKTYEYELDSRNMPEGMYFAKLMTSSGVKTLKMVLKR